MKSLTELKDRIESQLKDKTESLMIAMSNYHPLMIYHSDYVKEGFETNPLTEETVIKEMQDYMNFALRKAHNQRGISASRSVWKFVQWLWLLEDKELLAFAEDDNNFAMYGLPVLHKICEKYGFKEEY